MTSSESTIDLLEECLPLVEDRYLRCFYGEPWSFLTMYTAIMLLKIHLGDESWQTAKSVCGHRFLDLYYKHIGRQHTSLLSQQHPTSQSSLVHIDVSITTVLWRIMRRVFQKIVNSVLVRDTFEITI
jgi:hypothetical protein